MLAVVALQIVVLLQPLGQTDVNLSPMRKIDKRFLDTPFYGVRQMTWHLRNKGHPVNEKRIRRLMRLGFFFLVAIMDWHSRKVLAWRMSNTQEADVCVEALNEAIRRFGAPDIMNTDQGSQFKSFAWTDRLERAGCQISMDGKVRFIDNVFIERLWRSQKHECIYLHAWETVSQAKAGIGQWMAFHNHHRPHSALGGTSQAVLYRRAINATQTDQLVQKVA